ncbi:hypothetical protein PLICRDRAFT_43721 [Plicaturopsis crispa FD-325 SS-3]|nr:hypothetical protein PLICRDRAFT_43721 [Plicaturopsis crispa FD-325 SS-3]
MEQHRQHEDPGSSFSPGLVLPTPSMQNQIHELAKSLPPPRKQNTACDACRARKVKCHRLPGNDKVCQHCLSKNYPCTHHIQQATSEKKRGTNVSRRPRNISTSSSTSRTPYFPPQQTEFPAGIRHTSFSSGSPSPNSAKPDLGKSSVSVSPPPVGPAYEPTAVPQYRTQGVPVTLETDTRQLLAYLFAPPNASSQDTQFLAYDGSRLSPYAAWGELAHKLEDETYRNQFSLDLVEVFFQIVHIRLPLLNPAQFRARLNINCPANGSKRLHPALVATVLAWGTKFSEHPLLVADRARPGGQSFLAKVLVNRARELAEALKVYRIASSDHVVICLFIETLQSQNPDDSEGFHGFWLTAAIRHLFEMQINHKSVMTNIKDPEARGTMIFAWWMTCLADAYHSVYYRKKPMLDDDDYDIDFYTADPVTSDALDTQGPKPSPREQLEFLGYYRAAHAMARIARQMARQLWRPATESEGVPIEVLHTFRLSLNEWRDQYLPQVGVPSNFEAEWDFISAISACASDATYHLMWIVLFNALDDFGVRDMDTMPDDAIARVEELQRKITDEAVHGALRIAGLAGVLATNGYLRLDPAAMHVSCFQAGMLLARLGRPEAHNCIAGLEQYSYAYEEARGQVTEMKLAATSAQAGDFDFNHMASLVPRITPAAVESNAMNVDQLDVGIGTRGGSQLF